MLWPTFLAAIPDHRRPPGRLYALGPLRLFSLLAILSDAKSYRKLQRFIQTRLPQLNARCGRPGKRAPAPTAIRYPVQGLNPAAVDMAFRHPAAVLDEPRTGLRGLAVDGKTLRGRCARFPAQNAIQVLRALAPDRTLIRGHVLISAADTSPEIAAAQQWLEALGLSGRLFTLEARHGQQNGRVRHRH